jgi:hypothetical protein
MPKNPEKAKMGRHINKTIAPIVHNPFHLRINRTVSL